jgi:hypothetical protein
MFSLAGLARCATFVILAGALAFAAAPAPQTGRAVLSRLPVEPDKRPPVEVVALKVAGAAVEPGRPFPAGDGWPSGLTFTLKNVSDRPVSFVELAVRFPARDGRGNRHVTLGLRYGCWPGSRCYPDAAGDHGEIAPGGTKEIGLGEKVYLQWAGVLRDMGAAEPFAAAEFGVDSVFFGADERWSRGLLFRRDPAEPGTYRMVGPYRPPGQK